MTKAEWKKSRGELRKLLHNPRLRVSGKFVRYYRLNQKGKLVEGIYNLSSKRMIAELSIKDLKLQPNSFYRHIIEDILPSDRVSPLEAKTGFYRTAKIIKAKFEEATT